MNTVAKHLEASGRRVPRGLLLLLVFLLTIPSSSAAYGVPTNPTPAGSTGVIVPHGSRPAIHLPTAQSRSPSISNGTSINWAGYVILPSKGPVTDVNGSWIQPSVSCSSSSSYSAFWVGIDGYNESDNTVEQIGTESDCQAGSPVYYAWYEFYGFPVIGSAGSILIGTVPVVPGDVISAGVSCQADGLQCTVSITDVTSRESFSYTQAFNPLFTPQLSSGEWIVEAPSTGFGRQLRLANFGTIYFGQDKTAVSSSDTATVNGVSGPVGSFAEDAIEVAMVSQATGSVRAQPSGLSQDGTSFSVAFGSGATTPSPPAGGVLTASCSPAPVMVGSATTCVATVQTLGSVVPTGKVSWSSNSSGTFSHASCRLSKGSCSVKFTPTTASTSVGLLASYGGDSEYSSSSGTYVLMVTVKASKTTVSCTPTKVPAASMNEVTCKAKVSGYAPTGTVSWSQGGNGSVSFVNTTCTLSDGSCVVTLTGTQPGNVTLQARYGGDLNNAASSGTKGFKVGKESTTVTIVCPSPELSVGMPAKCEATVAGYSPTGTVTWSKVSGSGSIKLSSKTCTLSSGSCSVTITSTAAGSAKVKAAYGGDSNNLKGSGTFVFTIG